MIGNKLKYYIYCLYTLLFVQQIVFASTPSKIPDIFLKADINRTSVIMGQGIKINYYLYSKYSKFQISFHKFPPYYNFIKRYSKVGDKKEEVIINKIKYTKALVFSSKIFPLKTGKIAIRPLSVKVKILNKLHNQINNKVSISRIVSTKQNIIHVREIRKDKIPKSFSGLVGDFTLTLKINRVNFIKNDTISIDYIIVGDGQLESYKAPVLLTSSLVKIFDTRESIFKINNIPAKRIQITYLVKYSGIIKEHFVSDTFYSATNHKFYTKKILLPRISIKSDKNISEIKNLQHVIPNTYNIGRDELNIIAPSVPVRGKINIIFSSTNIKYLLIFILLLVIFPWNKLNLRDHKIVKLKGGLNYHSYYNLIKRIYPDTDETLLELITSKKLKKFLKISEADYLLKLYNECILNYKSSCNKNRRIKINIKKFTKIIKKIKSQ